MTTMSQRAGGIVNRLISIFLAAILFFATPGFRGWQALATEVRAPDSPEISGSNSVVPQDVKSLDFSVNPPISDSEELDKKLNPTLEGALEIKPETALSVRPPLPAQEKSFLKTGKEIGSVQKSLTPAIAGLKNTSASAQSSFSLGRRIWNLFSGRKDSNGAVASVAELDVAPGRALPVASPALLPNQDQERAASPAAWGELNVPSPQNNDAILADLRAHPPAALFFDYDMTLTDLDERGMSRPISDDVLEGLKKLLRAGWPIGIVTSRSFDHQSAKEVIPNTLWEPLIKKIPEPLRKNLFFVGGVGSELIAFKNGKPVRYLDRDWSATEKNKISKILSESLTELNIPADAVNIDLGSRAQTAVWFHQKNDPRLSSLAELLGRKLRENGLLYTVFEGGKSVYFSKFDKGIGVSLIYSAMRERGFSVTEDNLLFLGDQFHLFPNGGMGGDARMALAFPKSRAISVGDDKMSGILPENTAWIEGPHARGTIRVIHELLKLSPPSTAGAFGKKMGLFFGAAFAGVIGVIALQAFGLIPHAWFLVLGPLDFIGTLGVFLLRLSSLPQLFDNFRLGRVATADLSLKSTLLWLGASVLLSLVAVLNHKSPLWIVSNITGVLQGALMLFQILFYNRQGFGKAFAAVALMGLSVPLALVGVGLPVALWSSLIFFAAMALVFTINIPQVVANYKLYQAEHRAPRINPFFPALLISGNFLSLVTAAARGDIYWILSNLLSIAVPTILLAQIYIPGKINAAIQKVLNALKKAF